MTPTEQAADRVKAWIATPNTFEYPDADDLTALLSALTALQARAEDAERRVEEMEQADSRWVIRFSEVREASGIGYAPMLSEVPAAIRAKLGGYEFVCALMAAAAERSYPQSTVDSILRAAFPLALASERSEFLALLTPPLEQE